MPNTEVVIKFAIKKSSVVERAKIEPSVSRGATTPHGFVKGVFQLVTAKKIVIKVKG